MCIGAHSVEFNLVLCPPYLYIPKTPLFSVPYTVLFSDSKTNKVGSDFSTVRVIKFLD